LNIVFIHPRFSAENILKQPWRDSYELARHLAERGHKVTILTDADCCRINKIEILKMPAPYLRFKLNRIKSCLNEANVVLYFGNSLSGIYLRKLSGLDIPLVIYISGTHLTLHELKWLSFRELVYNYYAVIFSLPIMRRVTKLLNNPQISVIVVPNEILKGRLEECGVDKRKIKVAPLTFNARSFYFGCNKESILAVRERLGLPKNNTIITYFGSPLTIRGTDILIKSAQALKKKLKEFKVVILSRSESFLDSKEEKILRRLVRKLDLCENVMIISGVLSSGAIKDYISASDIIVLPFKIVQSEPPLSILESMAMAKPIITTSTCGIPNLVTSDRGILVKPADNVALALAIQAVIQNPDRRHTLGQQAREFVLTLPCWRTTAEWFERLFYSLKEGK